MVEIQYIGISELSQDKKDRLNTLAVKYTEKFERTINNISKVVVHVKTYKEKATKEKYAISVRVMAPTKIFRSGHADWEIATACHRAFIDIEKEMQHRFHTDVSREKPYS